MRVITREDKYLALYPDAESIDFINKELKYSNELLAQGEKCDWVSIGSMGEKSTYDILRSVKKWS